MSNSQEIGYVTSVNDYLVSITGLPNCRINEIVTNTQGVRGIVTTLKDETVDVLMLDHQPIRPKDVFSRTGKTFSIKAGEYLLGRAINPLGMPIDGKTRLVGEGVELGVEQPIRGIKTRQTIKKQFETGLLIVDMLVPVARGQRELIVGNARSGKTSFLIDTIVNQKDKNVVCIYTMVGKPIREIRSLVDILNVNGALSYSVVVAASSSDLASLIFLGPSVGISIAEYFQKKGRDVLLVMDDLGAHAKFYREISLLSDKSPGRESYPGDIFFQHAKIMERAGNFNPQNGGGSITALPVIEINLDDFTSYIPTNLMAMTDGHLMFDSSVYHQGIRPAIDISLSVSRVGKQTQSLPQKMLADKIRSALAEAARFETLSRFGSEISSQTQQLLNSSEQIKKLLVQSALSKIPTSIQMALLSLVFTPFLQSRDSAFVEKNKDIIVQYLTSKDVLPNLEKKIGQLKNDDELILLVKQLIPTLEKLCQQSAN